ncbi:hypothetical protein [Streptomyces cavernicola]|uniref:Uncharacterized protein n=1 Tax=Streptomyces cavernicola TaxID=3043613 RepID=A0ABT6SL10_9ACTN|nr:hypothetical protein [Streptomyces sp. B-S-A6]MDI3408549.1 hypothetical protein [Streptomyces sp. B-S-A6]
MTVFPIEGRQILTYALWLLGLASLAVIAMLVAGVLDLVHDLEHPYDNGWSGWQCPPEDAPCKP